MATKKATQQTTEQKAAEAKAAEEKAAENAEAEAESTASGNKDGTPEVAAAAAGNEAGNPENTEEKPAAELASVEELAGRFRAPSWQTAALNRLMGWEAGKKVTEKEYQAALARLKNRRIGG